MKEGAAVIPPKSPVIEPMQGGSPRRIGESPRRMDEIMSSVQESRIFERADSMYSGN